MILQIKYSTGDLIIDLPVIYLDNTIILKSINLLYSCSSMGEYGSSRI